MELQKIMDNLMDSVYQVKLTNIQIVFTASIFIFSLISFVISKKQKIQNIPRRIDHSNLSNMYAEYIKESLLIFAMEHTTGVEMEDIDTYITKKLSSLSKAKAFVDEFKETFRQQRNVRRSQRLKA